MKKEFSVSWNSSKQTRKQRKYLANAPKHTKRKIMSAHLSKDLKSKYGKRSFPIRKEDEVKIMRGKFKGKTGKVGIVNTRKMMVTIESIQKPKKDGTKVNVYFSPSNLLIQNLNLKDKKRIKSLERKDKKVRTESKETKDNKEKK